MLGLATVYSKAPESNYMCPNLATLASSDSDSDK